MALFQPCKITSSQLNSLSINEGQLIITTDDGNLYMDVNSNTRKQIAKDGVPEYEIVESLPTGEAIDPNKIYLIAVD